MSLFSKPEIKNYNYQVSQYKGVSPRLNASLNLGDGSKADNTCPISSRYQSILMQKGEQLQQKPPNFVRDSMNVIDIHGCQPKVRHVNTIPSLNRSVDPVNFEPPSSPSSILKKQGLKP